MAEQKFNIKSGFYNSINQDRLYSAEDINRPYSRLISEGIFATKEGTPSTDFQVLATDNGMSITVKKGEAMLAKKWVESPSDITITVSNNTGIVPRKDSIILQVDKKESGRIANIIYREGIASSNPVPPVLSEDEEIVEMRIANIDVAAGVNKIEQLAITDLRGSNECLWITSLIQQVDTSELFKQWQQAYADLFNKMKEELNSVEDGSAFLLKNKFEYIKYTQKISPGASKTEKYVKLPEGFDSSNCIIVSCMHCLGYYEDDSDKNFGSEYKYLNNDTSLNLKMGYHNNLLWILYNPPQVSLDCWLHIKILVYKYL